MASTRIEICGGIASGKTTLASLFHGSNRAVLFEDFHSNPFWRLFYINPDEHAFETEITFLLQHYSQIKTAGSQTAHVVCDYSLLQDVAYADVNLSGGQLKAFRSVYDEVARGLSAPSLIVHLKCSEQEELSRVRRRARAEEADTTVDYLAALNVAIEARVNSMASNVRILAIDSEQKDFANDQGDKKDVVRLVLAELRDGQLGERRSPRSTDSN